MISGERSPIICLAPVTGTHGLGSQPGAREGESPRRRTGLLERLAFGLVRILILLPNSAGHLDHNNGLPKEAQGTEQARIESGGTPAGLTASRNTPHKFNEPELAHLIRAPCSAPGVGR